MPEFTVIKLKNFKGGLHLARGLTNAYDKTLEQLHSDTLKSAIFVCALQLYGAKLIDKSFLSKFRISSAFPFYSSKEQDKTFYFFPKPEVIKLPFQINGSDSGYEKELKKVRFIEKGLFQELLNGISINNPVTLKRENIQDSFATGQDIDLRKILARENCDAITKSEPYQHVHIPRDFGSDSKPYYVDKIYFHENAGLFFLLEASGEVKKQVMSAIKLLADNGIGTDRNIGNGQFEYNEEAMSLDTPDENTAKYQLNLSLYCPEKDEIQDDITKSFYGLTKRGGYISSPEKPEHQTIRKRSIYMFTEGSIFPKSNSSQRKGKIVDLKPSYDTLNHPIWRDGQPIFVPFNYPDNE